MSETSTIVLVPMIFAVLIFIARFYGRESASSTRNPSFLLALATLLAAGLFLVLRVTDLLSLYGVIGFGLLGLVLLGVSIARIFML